MNIPRFISILVCISVWIGCNNHSKEQTSKPETPVSTVDSVFTAEDSSDSLFQDITDSIFADQYYVQTHGLYRPKIDRIKDQCHLIDSTTTWTSIDTVNNLLEFESTGGNAVVKSVKDSMVRYTLTVYGEMGTYQFNYYVLNDGLVLLYTKESQYQYPEGHTFIDSKNNTEIAYDLEVYEEDSYFVGDEIIYQFSYDCGAPNSIDYQKKVEKQALKDLKVLRNRFVTR